MGNSKEVHGYTFYVKKIILEEQHRRFNNGLPSRFTTSELNKALNTIILKRTRKLKIMWRRAISKEFEEWKPKEFGRNF
jgi:hypothetical protein